MMRKSTDSIAGMSLGGGKKENFFFCLLEYFENEKRWFLTSLNQLKEEGHLTQDEAITTWVDNTSTKRLVVDFPQTKPTCETCNLVCPGVENCHHPVVKDINEVIHNLLNEDLKRIKDNPKKYEQEREEGLKYDHMRSILDHETYEHILSRSFKRKLKKGFVPYWNRPIDFWLWLNYYDQMLDTFGTTYDSFGNVSVMLLYKFHYLLRHLPGDLQIYESNLYIILLELYRSQVITRKTIMEVQDINVSTLARVKIARAIEKHFNIFIYDKDLELISKNKKAFESFILAVSGKAMVKGQIKKIPELGVQEKSHFIVPKFS